MSGWLCAPELVAYLCGGAESVKVSCHPGATGCSFLEDERAEQKVYSTQSCHGLEPRMRRRGRGRCC